MKRLPGFVSHQKVYYKNNTRAFSLLELLISLAIMSIISALVVTAFASMGKSYTTQNVASEAQQSLRISTEFMARDIRLAGLDPELTDDFEILTATPLIFRFEADKNLDGNMDADETVLYTFAGSTLTIDDGAGAETLLDNITNAGFTYFDEDGNQLPGSPDTTLVRSVGISITVEYPAGRGNPVVRTYSTRVRCRNIGIQ